MANPRTFRSLRPRLLASLALAAALALSGPARSLDESDVLTALVVRVVAPPNPVLGADDNIHLAYELHVVNQSTVLVTIDSIEALNAADGAVLQSLKGKGLGGVFVISGGGQGATLPPSHSGYIFMDVTLPADAPPPKELVHRFATSRQLAVSTEDTHHGIPVTPESGVAPASVFTGVPIQVSSAPAVVLAPPLRGDRWLATNGCCVVTSHRGATLAIDGTVHVAERFAIDFVQLDAQGRLFTGPVDQLKSYAYFGVDVLSVADGTVVATVDGNPEQVPGALPKGQTIATAGGNHIVVDIGGGRFAFYAHLQPGSLRVKKGDRVRTGDVLGLLGNTGNTDGPHLHFHVMDGPSPLASNGLPYVLTAFTGEGVVTDEPPLFKGEPAPIDRAALAGPHKDQLPLNDQIVSFAD